MLLPFQVIDTVTRTAAGLEDGVQIEDVIIFCSGGIIVLTFFGILWGKAVWPVWKRIKVFMDWLEKFREDWDGVAGDAGHAKVPGVMERLNRIDGEVSRNGGSSMKDALVKAVAAAEANGEAIAAVKDDIAVVKETVQSMVSPTAGGADNRINTDGGNQ